MQGIVGRKEVDMEGRRYFGVDASENLILL